MKMGLFMFAEFIEIAIIGALFTTLFLGGYNLPFMTDDGLRACRGARDRRSPTASIVVIQLVVFLAKVLLVCSFQILVRWSLPRFRYDQLLALRLEVHVPAGARQPDGDRRRRLGAALAGSAHANMKPYVRKQYWNASDDVVVGARVPARDRARPLHHRRRVHAQHVALDHVPQRRAHDLLPGGDARRLRAAQPRQARADAAPRRPPQCIACNMCATVCPAKVIEIEAGFDPGRSGAPEVSGALRDRLFALHLLRAVRRGLPGRRDPHGQGSAEPADVRPRQHVAVAARSCSPGTRRATSPSPIRAKGGVHRPSRTGMIETLLLWLFAGTALVAAALMLVLRHPMRVALALVGDHARRSPASMRCSACT